MLSPWGTQVALLLSHLLLVGILGWYLITNLQWYNYKLERVLFKHHKRAWHLLYFLLPVGLYYAFSSSWVYWVYFYAVALPMFVLWHRKQDKKLVLTGRVKRFFALLFIVALLQDLLCLAIWHCQLFGLLLPLMITLAISTAIEKYLFLLYYRQAKAKLASRPQLKIAAITASYGKTSIKNFLAHLCAQRYNVYKTPRSVNTLGGLVKDINESLPPDIDLYIAEAGAREPGDIADIALFLEPSYLIIGTVGEAHIDYFKNLDRTRATKKELLLSPKRRWALVHESAGEVEAAPGIVRFGPSYDYKITACQGDLSGISFTLATPEGSFAFQAPLLGSFNAENIAMALLLARELGLSWEELQASTATLPVVEHRLQRIDAGGKIILDDSFNGNPAGIKEGIRLCRLHPGRKIIVTPGLVESTKEANEEIAHLIDVTFDLAIITGSLNAALFKEKLKHPEVIILGNKETLTSILAEKTRLGDLIYFANDAPTFI
ncbi:MAG: UDP-N-acetylmuramoyl-tripeptide--D-alanyl-D-alanine ligase [Campylobacterales bacterium]